MSNDLVEGKKSVSNGFEMRPQNLEEAIKFSEMIAKSSLVPKEYKDKPEDVLIAIQMGSEVGLPPLQSIQSISVINGRPTIWGDAALALVMKHPSFEECKEVIAEDKEGNHRAYCTIRRKGHEPHTSEFSVNDARKAGLWGKSGSWSTYPKRMLQVRARGFAIRDKFPDALKGISIREEVLDYEEIKVSDGTSYAQEKHDKPHMTKADYLAQRIKVVEPVLPIEAEFIEDSYVEEPMESLLDEKLKGQLI